MPLTGLANAAIDRIAPDAAAFARGLAAYGEADLLCYRVEGPAALAARQAELWDPILAWAQQRYEIVFEPALGIIHMPQPPETLARLGRGGRGPRPVRARRPVAFGHDFRLAARSPSRSPRGRFRSIRPGPRRRSTSSGRPSNGARTRKRRRRSPTAAAISPPPPASSPCSSPPVARRRLIWLRRRGRRLIGRRRCFVRRARQEPARDHQPGEDQRHRFGGEGVDPEAPAEMVEDRRRQIFPDGEAQRVEHDQLAEAAKLRPPPQAAARPNAISSPETSARMRPGQQHRHVVGRVAHRVEIDGRDRPLRVKHGALGASGGRE